MLALNEHVHSHTDTTLMAEFASAIESNAGTFNAQIDAIAARYRRHAADGDHAYKLAAETYLSILSESQLFIEGNHRTGSLIASWINLYAGYPPIVLSVENAVDYSALSAAIKSSPADRPGVADNGWPNTERRFACSGSSTSSTNSVGSVEEARRAVGRGVDIVARGSCQSMRPGR